MVRLSDILDPQRVQVPVAGQTKEQVIEELLDLLVRAGAITDRDEALRVILTRESTRTTGIGNGVAIPHGKCAGLGGVSVAIGICRSGVDFDSVDQAPVQLVVLLVSPVDQTGLHIQALARVSRLLSIDAFRRRLIQSASAQDVCSAIEEQESELTTA